MGVEQWAWYHFGRWALIYSYSGLVLCVTILSDDEDIKRESNQKLPDSTNLQRMEIPMERTSQKKTLINPCTGSDSHYPHGSPLPPYNYYRWVITTPMGHHTADSLHLFICLSLPSFELHFQIFQTFEGLSRGVARWISRLLSPRPTPPGPLAGVKRKTFSGYPAIYSYSGQSLLSSKSIQSVDIPQSTHTADNLCCHQNLLFQVYERRHFRKRTRWNVWN